MKDTELRKGNIIGFKKHGFSLWTTVNSIHYNGMIGHRVVNDSAGSSPSQLTGIPLTEEWLLRLGFEKYDVKGFYTIDTWFKVSLYGDVELQSGDMYEYHSVSAQSSYVHQLQNLYFALTQKELSLKDENTL